jgi:hypothetical protein
VEKFSVSCRRRNLSMEVQSIVKLLQGTTYSQKIANKRPYPEIYSISQS